jgi:molybdopterin-guanine dinucleotide biosynthesis protein A
MGSDKAALSFAGSTLLGRAVAQLRGVVEHVYVSSRADQEGSDVRAPYALIADQTAGIGPAAGLLAAHELFPAAAWLVLAVDMPLVTSAELARLVRARDAAAAATAWRSPDDGKPEPLCAIYEPATLAALARHIEQGGSSSLRGWLESAEVKYLPDSSSEWLRSANTPAELANLSRWRAAQNH